MSDTIETTRLRALLERAALPACEARLCEAEPLPWPAWYVMPVAATISRDGERIAEVMWDGPGLWNNDATATVAAARAQLFAAIPTALPGLLDAAERAKRELATATASVQQLRADVELATAQRDAETCRADNAEAECRALAEAFTHDLRDLRVAARAAGWDGSSATTENMVAAIRAGARAESATNRAGFLGHSVASVVEARDGDAAVDAEQRVVRELAMVTAQRDALWQQRNAVILERDRALAIRDGRSTILSARRDLGAVEDLAILPPADYSLLRDSWASMLRRHQAAAEHKNAPCGYWIASRPHRRTYTYGEMAEHIESRSPVGEEYLRETLDAIISMRVLSDAHLAELLGAGFDEGIYKAANRVVAERDAAMSDAARLRGEVEAVTAERDRLQRACDEGLPREYIECPACGKQHLEWFRHDAPGIDGRKRPHHTHRCYHCEHVWDSGRWSFGADVPKPAERATARREGAELAEALVDTFWPTINAKRIDLIERDIAGAITQAESVLLAHLQAAAEVATRSLTAGLIAALPLNVPRGPT